MSTFPGVCGGIALKINWINQQNSTARSVAIGTFDGVHLGHRQLLQAAVANRPLGGTSAVLTFDVPPQQFFGGQIRLVSSFAQKVKLIQSLGIEEIAWFHFNEELSSLKPRDFVSQILIQALKTRHVICGLDFRFGKNRAGDPQLLQEMAQELKFALTVVAPVKSNGSEMVSSSAIRSLIAKGEIGPAADLLGYFPSYWGRVVPGAGRGRQLGFPTANLEIDPQVLLPKEGVYLTWALLEDKQGVPALTSIGSNPTFAGRVQTVETFLLDFAEDLYGQQLEIQFLKRLRDIVRFSTAGELQKQIQADLALGRRLLAEFHLQGPKVMLK